MALDRHDIAGSTLVAFAAQGVSMFISILQSLIVPKLLGVTEYSYWQLFIFYSGYVGFFHFGLNDGVYLLMGGKSRDEIDSRSVKSQLLLGVSLQAFIALLFVMLSITGVFGPDRSFVIFATGIYLVIQNSASYLAYVLQAMNETRKSSVSSIFSRLFFLIALSAVLLMGSTSYRPIVTAYVMSASVQLMYCGWCCRDILASKFTGWESAACDARESVGSGIKLMFANVASGLILGVMRLAIDARWGIEAFGKLSFSLALVNFFLAYVTQAAMVLFPALRRSDPEEIKVFYEGMRDALSVCFPAVYVLYFPMVWLLARWLPAYADSFRYFAWLIPICVFDSKMNLTCTTLFKVRREEGVLLGINLFTTILCSALVFISVYVVGSVEAAVASAVISIVARSVISESIIARKLGVGISNVTYWEIALTISFILLTNLASSALAICCYCALYTLFIVTHWILVGKVWGSIIRMISV